MKRSDRPLKNAKVVTQYDYISSMKRNQTFPNTNIYEEINGTFKRLQIHQCMVLSRRT